jgi:hypothetical protein
MKIRRLETRTFTQQVNYIKVEIDKLKVQLDRKEEERRNENK